LEHNYTQIGVINQAKKHCFLLLFPFKKEYNGQKVGNKEALSPFESLLEALVLILK